MQDFLSNSSSIVQQRDTLPERITETSRFRRLRAKVHPTYIEQLDYRRERQVYLLTDGKRSIAQIASLLGLPPVEVAQIMKRLFEMEYVEYVSLEAQAGM